MPGVVPSLIQRRCASRAAWIESSTAAALDDEPVARRVESRSTNRLKQFVDQDINGEGAKTRRGGTADFADDADKLSNPPAVFICVICGPTPSFLASSRVRGSDRIELRLK